MHLICVQGHTVPVSTINLQLQVGHVWMCADLRVCCLKAGAILEQSLHNTLMALLCCQM